MVEVRLHRRGGQGVVMAAEIIAASMVKEDRWASCFPFFGSERRGAPVQAFLRYGTEPARIRNKIYQPDVVMILDSMLAENTAWYRGLHNNGVVIVNSRIEAVEKLVPSECTTIVTCDANRIALEVMNRSITNSTMVGCFAAATHAVDPDTLSDTLSEYFSGKVLDFNRECLKRGFQETKEYRRQEDGSFALCRGE